MKAIPAPVIPFKQLKKTLSARRKKNEVSKVRRVLAWPHKTSYWPALDEKCDLALRVLLEGLLSPARLPSYSHKTKKNLDSRQAIIIAKFREFRKQLMSPMALRIAYKKLRGDLRNATYSKPTDESKQLRSSLLLGVNAVSRALEKDETSMVLLAGDIHPRIMGNHIISMCFNKNVPALVMPSLRQCAKSSLGFNCIALGLKSSVSGNHFKSLQERVVELSEAFPKDESPQFQRVVPESTSDENVKEHAPHAVELDPSLDIYIYRTSKKERVFVPNVQPVIERAGEEEFGKDVISFDMGSKSIPSSATVLECLPQTSKEGDVTATQKHQVSHYRPLLVKNIKSNPDKVKKKKVKN